MAPTSILQHVFKTLYHRAYAAHVVANSATQRKPMSGEFMSTVVLQDHVLVLQLFVRTTQTAAATPALHN